MPTMPNKSSMLSTVAPLTIGRFFRLLADETRIVMVQLLTFSDLRAGEIGEALHLPSNAVSYHLKQFRALELLRDHRSSADARDVYYHLDVERLLTFYALAGDALYPGMSSMASTAGEQTNGEQVSAEQVSVEQATLRPLRVLFLCTHNSARSQLAEGILRKMGGEQVEVFSAGSEPTAVDPDAIVILREFGIDPALQTAKSLTLFTGQQFDYIITVCDRVRDLCPVFPGDPAQIHWSISDPALIEDPGRRLAAFRATAFELTTRLRYLLLLPHPATGQRMHPRG